MYLVCVPTLCKQREDYMNTKGQRFTWKSCKKITLRAFNLTK
uniref:Uncharacterized protein n=1 Tax=Tetranychus urticae TaxID=32264 RepID=T1KP94_TETUR